MATAVLITPSNTYNPHAHPHPAFASRYPTSVSTIPSMISPVESRRNPDDKDAHHHRQSLPSIQEVIHGKPSVYNPATAGPAGPPTPTLPSPFSSSATSSRTFVDTDKNLSPRSRHAPPKSFPPRPDPVSVFPESNRAPISSRPLPSSTAFPGRIPSPPARSDSFEACPRHAESRPPNGGYPYGSQPPAQGLYPHTGRLPPGQLPLSGFPGSPRQAGPPLQPPYDAPPRAGAFGEDEFNYNRRDEYKSTVDRTFEPWSYIDCLRQIGSSARTIYNFAEAFNVAAKEQQGSQPIPSRLPTEREASLMIDNCLIMKKKLEEVRDMAQQNRVSMERARDNNGRKGFDDDAMDMYPDLGKSYLSEVKKRRGRAAPPGRCHSCNRIDTPEWRRGPDGARTLCNACGLHYAKLERKRQLEQRTIRPKPAAEERG